MIGQGSGIDGKSHVDTGDGIRRYLDYAIELKDRQRELFSQVVGDYELLANSRT